MKIKMILYRLLSIFLAFLMMFITLNNIFLINTEAKTLDITKIADGNTMDDYIGKLLNDEYGSRYAGSVWSDKSVSIENITLDYDTDGYEGLVTNDSDFLHVFSALGSTYQITGKTPIDVMMVLDVSPSMGNPEDSTSKMSKSIDVINQSIDIILDSNPYNRVGLIAFSTQAIVLLDLKHHEKQENSQYISASYYDTQWGYICSKIFTYDGKETYTDLLNSSKGQNGGIGGYTNMDAGFWSGLSILANADTIIEETDGVNIDYISRKPVFIFLGDGDPNFMMGENDNKMKNWWEVQNPLEIKSNWGGDASWYNVPNIVIGTIMRVSLMKNVVDKHYKIAAKGTKNEDEINLEFYTIGLELGDLANTNNVATTQEHEAIAKAILNPKENFYRGDGHTFPAVSINVAYAGYKNWVTNFSSEFYSWLHTYNTNFSATENPEGILKITTSRGGAIGITYFSQLPNDEVTIYDITVTKDELVDTIENGYTDVFFDAQNVNDLEPMFNELIKWIISPTFIPLKDNLIYQDPIGEYMEVKNVKNILLFGELYDVVNDDEPIILENKIIQKYKIDTNLNIINPCYGNSNLIFNTQDIEIYVESIKDVSDSGLNNKINQTLYVNIPTVALPVQIASITLNNNQTIKSYTTNLSDKKQSTPLRIFYNVGIANQYLNENNNVDLSKINKEYITNHIDKNDMIYFLSNKYSNNIYNEYMYSNNDNVYTYGDPIVTFYPNLDNRYYIFQKKSIVYSTKNHPKGFDWNDDTQQQPDELEDNKDLIEAISINPKKWYYIEIEYYTPNKDTSTIQYMPILGSMLGSRISDDNVNFSEHLQYYNKETNEYIDVTQEDVNIEGFILVTKVNSVRIENISQNIKIKNVDNGENNTNTSYTYYLPTINYKSSTNKDDNYVNHTIFNNYLGNNGKLFVHIEDKKYNLSLKKQINGSMANMNDKFLFNITLIANVPEGTKFNISGSTTQDIIMFKNEEEIIIGSTIISLGHNDIIFINDIPKDSIIIITEENESYQTTYIVNNEKNIVGNTIEVTLNNNLEILCSNNLNGVIPTGLSLSYNIPIFIFMTFNTLWIIYIVKKRFKKLK